VCACATAMYTLGQRHENPIAQHALLLLILHRFPVPLPLQWTLGAVLFTEASGTACSAIADEITASGASALVVVVYVLVAGALVASVGVAMSRRGGMRRGSSHTKGISMA
jgi:hypothetical protein